MAQERTGVTGKGTIEQIQASRQLRALTGDSAREADALTTLCDALDATVANTAVTRSITRTEGLSFPGGGIVASGEAPSILSAKARRDLIAHVQKIGNGLFVGAGVLTVVIAGLDLVLGGQDVSGWWFGVALAFVIAGMLLYIIAYFTVMGFGKVTLNVRMGDTGESKQEEDKEPPDGDNTRDTGGDDKDRQTSPDTAKPAEGLAPDSSSD